jgi:hypothetical protein
MASHHPRSFIYGMAPPGGFSVERIIMVEIHVKNGAFTNKWDEPFTMPC